MIVGGMQKVSLIDYPGLVSSVLFTRGCNMRCIYCHNSDLVLPEKYTSEITEEEILKFLSERQNKIEAVVISGGEPTLHKDLPEFILKVKQFGYKIKLDTNGTNPVMLQNLIDNGLLDFVAMDIKTTFDKYPEICGVNINMQNIEKSIQIIKKSSLPSQFRTTVLKGKHTKEDIVKIRDIVSSPVELNNFKLSDTVLDNQLDESYEFSEKEFRQLSVN